MLQRQWSALSDRLLSFGPPVVSVFGCSLVFTLLKTQLITHKISSRETLLQSLSEIQFLIKNLERHESDMYDLYLWPFNLQQFLLQSRIVN